MDYLITENELKSLATVLENAPWKYSAPAMDILKQVVKRAQDEKHAATLADEVS